ncbi:angiotensinogen [Gastrophryne carolinensis]
MYLQYILLCLAVCTGLSTCNRVYVHPFNLFAYTKTECELLEKENITHLETLMPISIESEIREKERSQTVESYQKSRSLFTNLAFLAQQMNIRGAQAYQALRRGQASGTVLLSFSNLYWTVLSLYLGASGQTDFELQLFLGLTNTTKSTECTSKLDAKKVITALKIIDSSLVFNTGNIAASKTVGIFVSPNVPLSEKFIHDLAPSADYFYVRSVDFTDSAKAVNLINGFLDSRLLKPSKSALTSVNETANLVYIRHVYYKGKIRESFPIPELQPFWVEPTRQILVPMISTTGLFQFRNDSTKSQLILKIDLGKSHYLLLVQPFGEKTIENTELHIINGLEDLIFVRSKRYLHLTIPKLKVESSYDLTALLHNMHMPAILQRNSDFNKLNGQEINIGTVINTVHFDLEASGENEAGHEAGKTEEPLEVKFDKPFFFAIFEKTVNTMLLFGTIVNPLNTN